MLPRALCFHWLNVGTYLFERLLLNWHCICQENWTGRIWSNQITKHFTSNNSSGLITGDYKLTVCLQYWQLCIITIVILFIIIAIVKVLSWNTILLYHNIDINVYNHSKRNLFSRIYNENWLRINVTKDYEIIFCFQENFPNNSVKWSECKDRRTREISSTILMWLSFRTLETTINRSWKVCRLRHLANCENRARNDSTNNRSTSFFNIFVARGIKHLVDFDRILFAIPWYYP